MRRARVLVLALLLTGACGEDATLNESQPEEQLTLPTVPTTEESTLPPTTLPPTTLPPTTATSTTTTRRVVTTQAPVETSAAAGGDCHPSYRGACVPANASDVDCAGGSGNGPEYTGRVEVVGPDQYDLDRDGDGVGCES
ncbi:MAG: hypothetical protein M3P85_13870 [Actinomycetota bacterium]|nr:hypothetical protein [Actinomycetota bacterium]